MVCSVAATATSEVAVTRRESTKERGSLQPGYGLKNFPEKSQSPWLRDFVGSLELMLELKLKKMKEVRAAHISYMVSCSGG